MSAISAPPNAATWMERFPGSKINALQKALAGLASIKGAGELGRPKNYRGAPRGVGLSLAFARAPTSHSRRHRRRGRSLRSLRLTTTTTTTRRLGPGRRVADGTLRSVPSATLSLQSPRGPPIVPGVGLLVARPPTRLSHSVRSVRLSEWAGCPFPGPTAPSAPVVPPRAGALFGAGPLGRSLAASRARHHHPPITKSRKKPRGTQVAE